jgi:hypothetical protein
LQIAPRGKDGFFLARPGRNLSFRHPRPSRSCSIFVIETQSFIFGYTCVVLFCREVEREYVDNWLDVTTVGTQVGPSTPGTKATYLFLLVKYKVVPEPLRYLWHLVWRFVSGLLIHTLRLAVLSSAAGSEGGGLSPLIFLSHVFHIHTRPRIQTGEPLNRKIGGKRMGVIPKYHTLRRATNSWIAWRAAWKGMWIPGRRAWARVFYKATFPLEGYEESWLRRYGDEMDAAEVEAVKRQMETRSIVEPYC